MKTRTSPLWVILFAAGVSGLRLNATSVQTSVSNERDQVTQSANPQCTPRIYNPGFLLGPVWIGNDLEICDGDVHFIPKYPHGLTPHPASQITLVFFVCLALILLCATIGKLFEILLPPTPEKTHVSTSILFLIIACYVCFIPGVVLAVVQVDLRVHVDEPIEVQFATGWKVRTIGFPMFGLPGGVMLESMWSLIQTLWTIPGCALAGVFCAIYSLIVPGAKFLLFCAIYAMAKMPHICENDGGKKWLDRFLGAARIISKYDSPKLFVYLFLKMTFDGLHSPPRITAYAYMDLGFVLYALFSVGTLLACIAHHDFSESQTTYGKTFKRVAWSRYEPWSKWGLALFTTVAMAVFLFLFMLGCSLPLVSLSLDASPVLGGLAKELGLVRYVTFSLFGCVSHYFAHLSIVDVNPLICLILLLVFCIFFPILHMGAYVVAAYYRMSEKENAQQIVASTLWWSEMFGYLEMLDVLIIGVLGMFATSAPAISGAGVTQGIHIGCVFLVLAELFCYAFSWILSGDCAFYTSDWRDDETEPDVEPEKKAEDES